MNTVDLAPIYFEFRCFQVPVWKYAIWKGLLPKYIQVTIDIFGNFLTLVDILYLKLLFLRLSYALNCEMKYKRVSFEAKFCSFLEDIYVQRLEAAEYFI